MNDFTNKTSNKEVDKKQNKKQYQIAPPKLKNGLDHNKSRHKYIFKDHIHTHYGRSKNNIKTNEIKTTKLQRFPWESRINVKTYININDNSTVHIRN